MSKYAEEGKCVNCGKPLEYSIARGIWVCTDGDCNWGYRRLHYEDKDNLRIFAGYRIHDDDVFYPARPAGDAVQETEMRHNIEEWVMSYDLIMGERSPMNALAKSVITGFFGETVARARKLLADAPPEIKAALTEEGKGD